MSITLPPYPWGTFADDSTEFKVTQGQLRADLIKSLADNAALRERGRVLEDAHPEPDCRTCAHFDCISLGCHANRCDGVNMYEPLPPVRLWRTTSSPP